VELTSAASALEVLKRAVAAGHGEKDFSALVEPLRTAG
jgi:3-hydroxyisobutyrate dehydrogenase-like beta-hydroxyacid dehydrogenase